MEENHVKDYMEDVDDIARQLLFILHETGEDPMDDNTISSEVEFTIDTISMLYDVKSSQVSDDLAKSMMNQNDLILTAKRLRNNNLLH